MKKCKNSLLWGLVCCMCLMIAPCAMAGTGHSETLSIALDRSQGIDERIVAIKDLGASGDERVFDSLAVLLRDPTEDQAIRSAAVRAMAKLGEPRGDILDALEDVYREPETGKNLSYTILLYLGRMGATESLPLLTEALSNPDAAIRFKAAQALGMVTSDEAVRVLISHMNGEQDRMVRAEMVRAVGHTHNALTEATLVTVLRTDPEPLVRMNAAIMLGTFESLSDDARSALEASQDDPSPAVRKTVKGMLP